jgi:hypothetical protein
MVVPDGSKKEDTYRMMSPFQWDLMMLPELLCNEGARRDKFLEPTWSGLLCAQLRNQSCDRTHELQSRMPVKECMVL